MTFFANGTCGSCAFRNMERSCSISWSLGSATTPQMPRQSRRLYSGTLSFLLFHILPYKRTKGEHDKILFVMARRPSLEKERVLSQENLNLPPGYGSGNALYSTERHPGDSENHADNQTSLAETVTWLANFSATHGVAREHNNVVRADSISGGGSSSVLLGVLCGLSF